MDYKYKYIIKYSNIMNGGNITTSFPDYPNDLGLIRSNSWPPQKNKRIIIKDNENGLLKGTVVSYIWNNTASIIKLDNNNYVESTFISNKELNYGKGYYLLLGDFLWNYEDNKLDSQNTNKSENNKLDSQNINKSENNESDSSNIILSDNIASSRENDNINLNVEQINIKQENESSVTFKEDSIIPNNQINITENKNYTPLLSNPKYEYFSNEKIDIILTENKNVFKSLPADKIQILNRKLKAFELIKDSEIMIVNNKNIAINNIINDPADELNEGDKIKNWIINTFKNIFPDLIVKIHSGYVYITRKGVNVIDVINDKLVPNLKYFKWQNNKPIDYNTLKYVIFQNEFQKNIKENLLQKKEAEEILAQEWIIALQPSPFHLLWTIKKILMIWYGDPLFEKHIRKIKILINQFRANPKKKYNNKNGILPQIVVYPKYGYESARIVISKLEYYFSLYVDSNNNKSINKNNSCPTYFKQKNSLIFYTNGSLDLKQYIKSSFENNKFNNDIFTDKYTELIKSKSILSN